MLRDQVKQKDEKLLNQEWNSFEQHQAWWEKEQPLAPLPEELQSLLDQSDPTFVDELVLYAMYCENPYVRDKKTGYLVWVDQSTISKRERSWIWTLYLQNKPLARAGLQKLLTYFTYNELVKYQERFEGHLYSYYVMKDRQYYYCTINNNYYRYLKAIYKLAEKKQDIQTWALLTHWFDVERRYYNPLPRQKDSVQYSIQPKTRRYLTLRSWRTLRTLGERGLAEYVHMAAELLLQYSPKDKKTISVVNPDTNQHQSFPSYKELWIFNHILYHQSERFTYGSSTWQAKPDVYIEEPPEVREEAFPALWDQHPDQLLRLLQQATIPPVIHFAGRALRLGNPAFVTNMAEELLVELFQSPIIYRQEFAAREWLNRMDKIEPDLTKWFTLSTHTTPSIRKLANDFLRLHHHHWSKELKKQLITMCFDRIGTSAQTPFLDDWLQLFETDLRNMLSEMISMSLLNRFLTSSNSTIQQLVAQLLSYVEFEYHPYTANDLLPYLQSTMKSIRLVARQLLDQHFTQLDCTPEFLAAWSAIPFEDNQVFVTQFFADRMLWLVPFLPDLTNALWTLVQHPETPEITRNYIQTNLLGTLFLEELTTTPLEKVLGLLESSDSGLQELGARVLSVIKPDPTILPFEQLLQLAHNQIALARTEARNMIIQVIDQASEEWLIHLVETDWDDTRNWTFAYMRTLSADQFTSKLIYGLLDSAREDVQAFGMQLVDIHFRDLDIVELLLRTSESTDLFVQEYALSLAEKITWDATKVTRLELFFRTILFRVHQARKAKQMTLALLTRLSETNREMAEVIVPILSDVAHTGGRKDFERILLMLTRIQALYPDLQTPIQLR